MAAAGGLLSWRAGHGQVIEEQVVGHDTASGRLLSNARVGKLDKLTAQLTDVRMPPLRLRSHDCEWLRLVAAWGCELPALPLPSVR